MSNFLIGRQPEPPGPGRRCDYNLTLPLETLINALRDAEILGYGHISPSCVKNRFDVEFSGFD